MADDNMIQIQIVLDDGSVQKGFINIEKQANKTAQNIESAFTFKNILKGFAAIQTAILGLKAIGEVKTLFKEGIIEAQKQEDAINQLNTALKISNKYTDEASISIQRYAEELQKSSKYGDDVILQNAALIQSLGALNEDGLKKATKAALDMSAALGIDLTSASTLVGKAAVGEIGSFSRYGVVIKKGANEAETFANALTALQNKFGGAAASQINTFSGATAQLSNIFSDFIENIGMLTIKSPTLINIVKELSKFFVSLGESVKNFGSTNKDIIGDLINRFISVGYVVNKFIIAPIELAYNIIEIAFNSVRTIIASFVNSTAGLASSFVDIFSPDSELAQNLRDFRDSSELTFNDISGSAKKSFEDILNFDFTAGSEEKINQFKDFIDRLKETVKTGAKSVADETKNAGQNAINISQQVGKAMSDGFVNGFSAIGTALAQGKNVWKAFSNAILGVLGDFLINIGIVVSGIGKAAEAVKNAILRLDGITAVVAGAALIILGSALKSMAGGPAATGSTPTASGGGVATSASSSVVNQAPQQIQEKTTQVKIDVAGTVLSPREVGLQISQILTETFESTGTKVVVA